MEIDELLVTEPDDTAAINQTDEISKDKINTGTLMEVDISSSEPLIDKLKSIASQKSTNTLDEDENFIVRSTGNDSDSSEKIKKTGTASTQKKNKKRFIFNDSDESADEVNDKNGDQIESDSETKGSESPKSKIGKSRLKFVDSDDSDNEYSKGSFKNENETEKPKKFAAICDYESDNETSIPKIKSKSLAALCDSDSSDNEAEEKSQQSPKPKLNFSKILRDSSTDSSDNESQTPKVQEKNHKSNFSGLCDSESSGPENEAQNSDEDISINFKKSRGKKSTIEKPKKMTGKDALEQRKEIISESQRMTRESNVSLPYHRPKSHSLKEFLSKRKKVSDVLKTAHIPVTSLKLSAKQIEITAKKLEEREKNLDEFYKSSESDESDNENKNQKSDSENSNIQNETPSQKGPQEMEKGSENDTDNQKGLQDAFIKESETKKNETESPQIETKTILNEIESILNSGDKIQNGSNVLNTENMETLGEKTNENSFEKEKNWDLIDFEAKMDSTDVKIQDSEVNGDKNNEKFSDIDKNCTENVIKNSESGAPMCIEASRTESEPQDIPNLKISIESNPTSKEGSESCYKPETDNSKPQRSTKLSILEKLKKYNPNFNLKTDFKPKITKDSEVVILDNDLSEKVKAIDELKKRFFTHNKMKPVHTNDEKEIEMIDSNVLKHECAKVLIDHDNIDRVVEQKPGIKLKKLREELSVQMAKKRLENWEKQRQEVDELTKLDEELETCEGSKLALNEEEEEEDEEFEEEMSSETSSESEPEENDIILTDKPYAKSEFVDSEVEVSSDEDESSSDEESSSENIDNVDKSEKKSLKRIILNDDSDSNDFSDHEKDSELKNSLKEIINNLSEESNDKNYDDNESKSAQNGSQSLFDSNSDPKSLQNLSKTTENEYNLTEISRKPNDFDSNSQTDLHDTISLNSDDEIPLYQHENPNKTPLRTQTKSQFNFTPISCLTGMQSKPDFDSPQITLTEPSPLRNINRDKSAVKTNLFDSGNINMTQAFNELENLCSGTFTDNNCEDFQSQITQKESSHNFDFDDSQDFKLVFDDNFLDDNKNNDKNQILTTDGSQNIVKNSQNQTEINLNDSESKNHEGTDNGSQNVVQSSQNSQNETKNLLNDSEYKNRVTSGFDQNDFDSSQNSKKAVENGQNGVQNEEENQKVENHVGKLVLLSSDDENVAQDLLREKSRKKKRQKKRKLGFSDDEFSSESEDDASENLNVNYDSEENEIENLDEGSNDVNFDENEEIVPKKVAQTFFENEAELSESEWGSEDENEAGLDRFEIDECDFENYNEKKLQKELGKIHMRQVLDQDSREVRLLQEMLLEDGELHGASREKKFKWKNADSIDWNNGNENAQNDENDLDVDEIESELEWRKQRHERETFLQEQRKKILQSQNEIEIIASNSQILQIGKTIIEKNSQENVNSQKENDPSKLLKPEPPLSFLNQKSYRGSFLARSEISLSRLTELTKNSKDVVLGPNLIKNSRNFLFTAIEKDDVESTEAIESKKRKKIDDTKGTPKVLKKMRVSESPVTTPKSKKSLSKILK